VNQLVALKLGNSVQTTFDNIFSYIPNVLGFLIILVIGYFIAKAVKALINKALQHFKVDESLRNSSAGGFVEKVSPGGRPSQIIDGVVFWLIFLYVLTAAIGALKIPSVTQFMNQVLAYLPNVIAAVLIFVIAAALSGVVVAAVQKTMGDTPTGKLVETVVPGLIMAIAVFMILSQLKIATNIVTITYAALLGMLALTGALAFGLGGRDVAAQMWSQAYQKGQQQRQQVSQDAQLARDRGQQQVQQAQQSQGQQSQGQQSQGQPSQGQQPQGQQTYPTPEGTRVVDPGASTFQQGFPQN
jgi:hypothetical protein